MLRWGVAGDMFARQAAKTPPTGDSPAQRAELMAPIPLSLVGCKLLDLLSRTLDLPAIARQPAQT